MKRTLRVSAAFLVLVLLAAACGGGSDGGDDDAGGGGDGGDSEAALPECPLDALDDAEGPVEVTLWHSHIAKTADTLVALAQQFNDSQDQVVVEVQNQGQSYDELINKYNQALPTGDQPGIVILEDTQTQLMADSGTVLPAASCFEATDTDMSQFVPIGVGAYSVDGAMQPGSLSMNSYVLYYNRSHFIEAGLDPDTPPTTLAEMREAAEAIKEAGVVDTPMVQYLQAQLVENLLTGVGETIVNGNNGRDELATEATFDNERTLEIFEWIKGMNDDGLLLSVTGDGKVDHYFAMAQGDASMLIETSTAATTVDAVLAGQLDADDLGVENVENINPEGLDIGVAPMPGLEAAGKGQIGGGAFYVTADPTPPEVQAGAWRFIEFMNQVSSAVEWNLEGSYLPWVEAAVDDPVLVDAWTNTRKGRWLAIAYDSLLDRDPDFPGPLIGPYSETRAAIETALEELVLSGASPDEVIAKADEEITDALSTYEEENF
jgi:sn-glycerol 3-phosphate transport system substrate-binding protein